MWLETQQNRFGLQLAQGKTLISWELYLKLGRTSLWRKHKFCTKIITLLGQCTYSLGVNG